MSNNEWGVQKGSLSLQDSFLEYAHEGDAVNEYENIVLGNQEDSISADMNNDGQANILDIIILVNLIISL